jgi:hypothetical protein
MTRKTGYQKMTKNGTKRWIDRRKHLLISTEKLLRKKQEQKKKTRQLK